MSYANGTTHYNLPQTVGTDKRDWFDTNQAFQNVDADLYSAKTTADNAATDITALGTRVGTAEGNITSLDTRLGTAEGNISALQTGQTTLGNTIADVKADTMDAICSVKEADATADYAHAVGTYFWYNDTLYITTQAIAVGDTIVPNTNCNTTNVTAQLGAIKGDISDINTALTQLEMLEPDIHVDHTGKTWAVCLYNMLNLVDFDKVTPKTKLKIGNNVFSLIVKSATRLRFSQIDLDSNGDIRVLRANIEENSNVYSMNDNGTYSDVSSQSADSDVYLYY